MKSSSTFCAEWTGISEDTLTGETRAGTIWCKSWHCEHCAPRRRKMLQAQAAQGRPSTLITLTIPYGSHPTPDQAAAALVHAWRMTIQRAKRERILETIQYIAIFEETRQGWPHLHILCRAPYIKQAWLSARMKQYCNAPIVDIRRVYNARHAARYVAKYVSKAPKRYEGCKRYWRTHGYALEGKEPARLPAHNRRGSLTTAPIDVTARMYQGLGYAVDWDSDHSFTAYPDHWPRPRRATHHPPAHDPPPAKRNPT